MAIDWPEEIVVAGSASGSIKLWDLDHAKGLKYFDELSLLTEIRIHLFMLYSHSNPVGT